jgi:hypothetical protein
METLKMAVTRNINMKSVQNRLVILGLLQIILLTNSCSYKSFEEGSSFGVERSARPIRYSIDVISGTKTSLSFFQPTSINVSDNKKLRIVFHDTLTKVTIGASPGSLSSAIPFYRMIDTLLPPQFSLDLQPEKWFCEKITTNDSSKSFKASYIKINFWGNKGRFGNFTVYPKSYPCTYEKNQ